MEKLKIPHDDESLSVVTVSQSQNIIIPAIIHCARVNKVSEKFFCGQKSFLKPIAKCCEFLRWIKAIENSLNI